MTVLTCAAVRRRLPAFYDRELPVAELIAVDGARARTARRARATCGSSSRSATRCGSRRRRARPTTGPACSRA